MIKIIPRYVDHLWYPILVKPSGGGYHHIIEMQGKQVNNWNDMVQRQHDEETKNHPRGWCI